MVQFQYGKAITDSFRLIFSNLYIFVPILIGNIVGLLLSPFFYNAFTLDFSRDFIIKMAIFNLIMIVLSLIVYGWIFALFKQIVKKGKADLFAEFKNAPKKALRLLLTSLVLFLIFICLSILLMVIRELVYYFSAIIGTILTSLSFILLIIAWIISAIFLISVFIYAIPLIVLEDFGPIKTIKLSFEHFKSNKAHSFALVGIIVLFNAIAFFIMYAILFFVIGSISSESLLAYMIEKPFATSITYFFAGLPILVLYVWSFAFLTIAYARKKSKK